MEHRKVIRVTEKEFELDNGVVYPHVTQFEEAPSLEDFQDSYDKMFQMFQQQGLIDTDERASEHTESSGYDGSESTNAESVGGTG